MAIPIFLKMWLSLPWSDFHVSDYCYFAIYVKYCELAIITIVATVAFTYCNNCYFMSMRNPNGEQIHFLRRSLWDILHTWNDYEDDGKLLGVWASTVSGWASTALWWVFAVLGWFHGSGWTSMARGEGEPLWLQREPPGLQREPPWL
jgi:hypothetical protein